MTTVNDTLTTGAEDFRPELIFRTPIAPEPVAFEFDVAVVGLGYVGLPTALAYHSAGSRVLAFDVSGARLAAIRAGDVDLVPSDAERLAHVDDDRFLLTDDRVLLERAAAVVICVPTPVDEFLVPDLRTLKIACDMVVAHAVRGQLLMLTSTTYVGCTQDYMVDPLEARGLQVGVDVFAAFSAERIDPGNESFSHSDVPRVVGGATQQCEEAAAELLSRYTARVHRVRSLAAAEMTKLLENTFRAVNIALANEFADICRALDITVTDVIDAASTKPYGFMSFSPGPGVGGHCIPCDPRYLLWQLRKSRVDAPVISQAMNEIAVRPRRVVERVRDVLAQKAIGLAGAGVLVIGVSYKPDVADLRESPAIEILQRLAEADARVHYHDHHFDSIALPHGTVLANVVDPSRLDTDIVVIHTRHTTTDLTWLAPHHLVLDTTYRENELPERVLL